MTMFGSKRASTLEDDDTPSKKSKKSEIVDERNKDYQDPDADVTLVSSDGLVFKVHSYVLKTASIVLRDMITIGHSHDSEVIMTDKLLEGAETLSMFLDVASGKPLSPPDGSRRYQGYQRLIDFALKYECNALKQQLYSLIYKWCQEYTLGPFGVFVLAYTLDAPDLAAIAIRKSGRWHSTESKAGWGMKEMSDEAKKKARDRVGTIDSVVHAKCLDPSGMSLRHFKAMPGDYAYALTRACSGHIDQITNKTPSWEFIADRFISIMKEMGKME